MNKNNHGFIYTTSLLVGVVVVLVGLAGYWVFNNNQSTKKSAVYDPNAILLKSPKTSDSNSSKGAEAPTNTPKSDENPSTPAPTPTPTPTPTPQPSTNPTVTITSPTNGQIFSTPSYVYSCSFTAPNGDKTVSMVVKNSAGKVVESGTYNNITSDNCYEKSENTYNSFPNGNYTITYTVTDLAGKTATATNSFSWKL